MNEPPKITPNTPNPAIPTQMPTQAPTQAPTYIPAPMPVQMPATIIKKASIFQKIVQSIVVILFFSSILANVYMGILLAGIMAKPMSSTVLEKGDKDTIIAVYTVGGTITASTAGEFDLFYRMVRDDDDIKAVVIRVDSPGGYITASDQIYRMIGNIRSKLDKPVVVSMGSVAASGGYYISVPAEKIYAEPTSIVGSIGVIGIFPNFSRLADKIGVEMIVIRARQCTRYKAKPDMFSETPSDTRRELQNMLDKHHDNFVDIVLAARPGIVTTTHKSTPIKDAGGADITIDEVSPLNGEVFLPEEALELNLIDEIGSLGDAIAWLKNNKSKLGNAQVVRYSRSPSLMESMGVNSTGLTIDKELVQETLSARIMMLWKID